MLGYRCAQQQPAEGWHVLVQVHFDGAAVLVRRHGPASPVSTCMHQLLPTLIG
jgi:hypothetical protein